MQFHKEDEPRNTANKDQTFGDTALIPQSKLHGVHVFGSLLTGKHLRWSQWTPANMTTDVNEWYHTFNAQSCMIELIFVDPNEQTITPGYYNFYIMTMIARLLKMPLFIMKY